MDYLLDTYAIDDVVTKMQADMKYIHQSSNTYPTEYVEALRNKVLQCDRVFDKRFRKVFSLKGSLCILHKMRSYWGMEKKVAVHNQASLATLLIRLQHGSPSTYTWDTNKMNARCRNSGLRGTHNKNIEGRGRGQWHSYWTPSRTPPISTTLDMAPTAGEHSAFFLIVFVSDDNR